jgi:hypothetical protein
MRHALSIAILLAVLGSEAQAQQSAAARQSAYTSLETCETTRSVPEEAGYARADCEGLGGYGLERVDADDRQNLFVIPPGSEARSLSLPSLMGGGFSSLGPRAEWRGPLVGGALLPDAMIVRYAVVESAREPLRPVSYLLVIALGDTPCLAARVPPGQGQNQTARDIADAPLTCL